MQLVKADLLRVLRNLAAAMPAQKERNWEALAEGYYGALADCSVQEIEAAAATVVREDRFFPAASRLRAGALAYRNAHPGQQTGLGSPWQRMYDWWVNGMGEEQPCPYCGSVLACIVCGKSHRDCDGSDGGRLDVKHDRQRHDEARAPIIGRAA